MVSCLLLNVIAFMDGTSSFLTMNFNSHPGPLYGFGRGLHTLKSWGGSKGDPAWVPVRMGCLQGARGLLSLHMV